MKKIEFLMMSIVMGMIASATLAVTIPVAHPSFENQDGTFMTGMENGWWTSNGNDGTVSGATWIKYASASEKGGPYQALNSMYWAGSTYTLKFHARLVSGSDGKVAAHFMYLTPGDNWWNGCYVGCDKTYTLSSISSEWTEFTLTYTAPADADVSPIGKHIVIYFTFPATTVETQILMDDVSLTASPDPINMDVGHSSFENQEGVLVTGIGNGWWTANGYDGTVAGATWLKYSASSAVGGPYQALHGLYAANKTYILKFKAKLESGSNGLVKAKLMYLQPGDVYLNGTEVGCERTYTISTVSSEWTEFMLTYTAPTLEEGNPVGKHIVINFTFPATTVATQIRLDDISLQVVPCGWPACYSTWYDLSYSDGSDLDDLVTMGCNRVIHYADVADSIYLNAALALNLKVTMSAQLWINTNNLTNLAAFVDQVKDNPAMEGWYLYDEPGSSVLQLCEEGYDLIKSKSNKPVYMGFGCYNLDDSTCSPYTFRNAFDIMLYDEYPLADGTGEFVGLSSWMSSCDKVQTQAAAISKPFIITFQGYDSSQTNGAIRRLPSINETRFQIYYSLVKAGAADVTYWAYNYVTAAPASSSPNPYTGTGLQWLDDVGAPVMAELNTFAHAIDAGPTGDTLSIDRVYDTWWDEWWAQLWNIQDESVKVKVYGDPYTGKYYLLTLNTADSNKNFKITINGNGEWSSLVPYGNGNSISIVNRQVTLSYAPYQVRTFELVPAQ